MIMKIKKPFNTPIIKINGMLGITHFYIKDESTNPTHTFKDRLSFHLIKQFVKDIEKNKKNYFGCISYGNTAYSLGYYCNEINKLYNKEICEAIVFVPSKLKEKTLGPDTDGKYVKAISMLKEISRYCKIIKIDIDKKFYTDNDLLEKAKCRFPEIEIFKNISEGLEYPVYDELFIESVDDLKTVPDYIIVPFGAGILCNEIIDYINDRKLKTKVIPVSTGNPNSIALMLYGPYWVDTKSLLQYGKGETLYNKIDKKGRLREPYYVYNIQEEDILDSLIELKKLQISSEPSAAAGFAMVKNIKNIYSKFDPKKDVVLVINTGNGLLNFK